MKTASKIPNISRDCRSQAGNILQINLIFLWTMSTTLPIVLYVSKPYRKLRKRANETQRICRETLTDLDAVFSIWLSAFSLQTDTLGLSFVILVISNLNLSNAS